MPSKVTTLFIEDAGIKLLITEGKRVERWASAPLEPGLVKDGVIVDEAKVADKLKELFSMEEIKTRRVVAGLSGFNSLYRLLSLPEMPQAVLAEAVRHEASRVIPVSLDELYLSFQSISGAAVERQVFLAAYPRNSTDALVRTLNKAGLNPYLMDLAPLALCRLVEEARAIVIRVRGISLDIVVMVDRVPQVIRSLSLPGEAKSLTDKLSIVAEELDRTVAFYNSSHADKTLDTAVPIFVGGELAESPESWQLLSSVSGRRVSALPSPLESPEGFISSQFAVNIGLAQKELLGKGEELYSLVNINILPEVYRPKPPRLGRIIVPIGAGIGVGIIVVMMSLVQNATLYTQSLRDELLPLASNVAQQQRAIAALTTQVNQLQPLIKPAEAAATALNGTVVSLKDGRERMAEDLSQIVALLPETVNLSTIQHGGTSVGITGSASERDGFFEYTRSLRDSKRFSRILIESLAQSESGQVNFKMSLR